MKVNGWNCSNYLSSYFDIIDGIIKGAPDWLKD